MIIKIKQYIFFQVVTKIGKFKLMSETIPQQAKEAEKTNSPCLFCQSTYGKTIIIKNKYLQ